MSPVSSFCVQVGLLFALASAISPPQYSKCISKDFGHGGTVCVCSEQFCDSFAWGEPLSAQEYGVYTSSKAGDRFSLKTGRFNKTFGVKSSQTVVKLAVNKSVTFQKILGFGGAFTGQCWNVVEPLVTDLFSSSRRRHFTIGSFYDAVRFKYHKSSIKSSEGLI